MVLIRIIILFLVFFEFLFSINYEIKKGWNLLGSNENINIKDLNCDIAWKYKNKKWYFYSSNKKLVDLAKNKGYEQFYNINLQEGFWVYSNKDFNVTINGVKLECKNFKFNNSWQLVSFCKKINNGELDKFEDLLMWKYKNKKWYVYTSDNTLKDKLENYSITTISPNEGIWVKKIKKTNLFTVYYFYLDNNLLKPLVGVNVYDENNNLISKTDNDGKIVLNEIKTLHLDYKYFDNIPIKISSQKLDYVIVVSKKKNLLLKKASKLFDIGNYRLGSSKLFLEAQVIPIAFFSLNNKYGLIIDKFHIKTDTTIFFEEINEKNNSIIGSFKIKLKNNLGQSLSIEEDEFCGDFKPFIKSQKLNSDVVLMLKDGNKFKFLSDCIYINNKYIAKNYIKEIGEYVFVKKPLSYIHKINLNVKKAIIFDESLNPHIVYKQGSISTLHKEENVFIFADGYYPLKTVLRKNNNISLQKINYHKYCFNVFSAIGNKITNKTFVAKYKNRIYNITLDNNGSFCLYNDTDIVNLNIDDINYYINDNNLFIFNVFKKIDSNALTYSDLVDSNRSLLFVYNTISGAKVLDLEKDKNYSLENFYFNGYSNNLIGDLAGNIYYDLNRTSFSKDDFFDDIGYFVNPFVSSNYVYVPTTSAKIILLNKDGTNPYMPPIYLKIYDNNKTNDLVYLSDFNETDLIAIVNEGLVYDINKYTKNVKLLYKSNTMLNYYKFAKYQNGFIVLDNKNLVDIFSNKLLFQDIDKVLAKGSILGLEKRGIIIIYNNGKKLFNIKGKLIKLLLGNNNIFIITENKIYKNDLLIAEFKNKILNASFKKDYLLIEFNNGTNLILK